MALWRGAQFRGLYSLVDVSICRKFLRIDNAKIIAEAAIPLNGKDQPASITIKTLVSDTYNALPWPCVRNLPARSQHALRSICFQASGRAKRADRSRLVFPSNRIRFAWA